MPTFDYKTFAELTGRGTDPIAALGTSYGVPSCLMNLTKATLGLIQTAVLAAMRDDITKAKNAASSVQKNLANKLRKDTGITEFETDEGVYRHISNSSLMGSDSEGSGWDIAELLAKAQAAIATGGQIYNNVVATGTQLGDIKECLGKFKDFLDFSGGEAATKREELQTSNPVVYDTNLQDAYAVAVQQSKAAMDFQTSATIAIADIDSVISARAVDPSLNPLYLEEVPPEVTEKIFRLTFGPPKSKKGKFILSIDGLYFDSQKDGLAPALLELANRKESTESGDSWRLEYDPNLGGRGAPTSVNDLDVYFNTILDPNITDDSPYLQNYYDQDIALQDLTGQKFRRLYDLSGELDNLISTGAAQALIANSRQVMLSETAQFVTKINKRRKQIELAVKIPNIYGRGQVYAPGEVPVNDFSYLEGINFMLDLGSQRQITLKQDDVDGVVLPLQTKFTEQIQSDNSIVLNHLLLSRIGRASIIDNSPSSSAASISVNAEISEAGLFALYNLLSVGISETSGLNFDVFNGADTGTSYNAQLVGDMSSTFPLGIGVPYLKGVANPSNSSVSSVSSMGSYLRLPAKKEFQDLLYDNAGATFESWVHIPHFSGYDLGAEASGLYRVLLSNENTGIDANTSSQGDILNLDRNNNLTTVNGLVFGFTRDRRFTAKSLPSNVAADNPYYDSVMVLAPTQSFDSSSVGFLNSKLGDTCDSASSWLGMTVPVSGTQNGVSLSSCEDEFCHIVLTMNPLNNSIKYYMDGVNIATSSYESVFGINPAKKTPSIPSMYKSNSFRYDTTHVSVSSIEAAKYGPSLDESFTPWIIGGGYTDGNPNGNFMGGEYGGKASGLKGHVGSVKMYSRPLTPSEVVINYNATQNFFKNIAVSGI